MAAFPLEVAANNHEARGKQSKHKRVFLWFGDDGAIHPNAQAVILRMIRPTPQNSVARPVAVETARRRNVKVANRLVYHSGANPGDGSRRVVVVQLAVNLTRGPMSSQPVLGTSCIYMLEMVRLPRVAMDIVGTLVAVLGMVMSSLVLVVPSLMVCPSRAHRDSKSKGALVAVAVKSGVKAKLLPVVVVVPARKRASEVLWVSFRL